MGSNVYREIMPWSDQAMLVKLCMVVIMGIAKEPLGANLLPLTLAELFPARASALSWRFAGSKLRFTGIFGVQTSTIGALRMYVRLRGPFSLRGSIKRSSAVAGIPGIP